MKNEQIIRNKSSTWLGRMCACVVLCSFYHNLFYWLKLILRVSASRIFFSFFFHIFYYDIDWVTGKFPPLIPAHNQFSLDFIWISLILWASSQFPARFKSIRKVLCDARAFHNLIHLTSTNKRIDDETKPKIIDRERNPMFGKVILLHFYVVWGYDYLIKKC